jgi:hypothetical protein
VAEAVVEGDRYYSRGSGSEGDTGTTVGEAVVEGRQELQETLETHPFSLSCQRGNIDVSFTIDNVKSITL